MPYKVLIKNKIYILCFPINITEQNKENELLIDNNINSFINEEIKNIISNLSINNLNIFKNDLINNYKNYINNDFDCYFDNINNINDYFNNLIKICKNINKKDLLDFIDIYIINNSHKSIFIIN